MDDKWSKSTKYFVIGLIIVVGVWLVFAIGELIGPLIISVLLAYVLNPAVHFLVERTRFNRTWASITVYLFFLVAIVAIPSILTPTIVRQVTRFTRDIQNVEQNVEEFLGQPIIIGGVMLSPGVAISNLDQIISDSIGPMTTGAIDLLGNLTTNLVWVLVIIVTTYYLLKDAPKFRQWCLRISPESYRSDINRLLSEIDFVCGSFLRGQITLMLAIGIMTGVFTAVVGLRGAFVLGIVAGVLDVIPSLGPMVAGLIAVLVGFFLGSSYLAISNFWFGIVVLGIFVLIQQIENIWLRPQIMGHTLQLHPALVFVGVLGSLALFGVFGALVIIPLMASVKILGRYIHARLLGRKPWPEEKIETEDDPAANVAVSAV